MLNRLLGNRNFEKDKDRLMIGGKGAGTADRMFSPITGNEYPNYVPPLRGWNNTDSTYIDFTRNTGYGIESTYMGLVFPANKSCHAFGSFITPLYFTGDLLIYSLYCESAFVSTPPQQFCFKTSLRRWNKVEEARNPWTNYEVGETSYTENYAGEHAYGVIHVAGMHVFISEQNHLMVGGQRKGLDAFDTSSDDLMFLGWWVLYTASTAETELA